MTLSLREPTSIDELLNYRLLRVFATSGAPVIRLLEGRYGLARREWRLLAVLASAGPLSPSDLAQRAHLDRPRTSRAIGSLARKQLVLRAVLPGDGRRARVALSAGGRTLYDEIFPQVAAINRAIVEALDDPTLRVLDAALERLTARAEQLNAQLAQDVRADRWAGSARRPRPRPDPA